MCRSFTRTNRRKRGKIKMGWCEYYHTFCDDEEIEKKQEEAGEQCYIECQECEWYEK